MVCSNNCSYDGAESGLSCNLCEKWFHAKRTKLPARTTDLLENNTTGLHWFCDDCRKPGFLLVKKHQVALKAFDELSSKLLALQGEFAKLAAALRAPEILSLVENQVKLGSNKREKKKKNEDTVVSKVVPPVGVHNDDGSSLVPAHKKQFAADRAVTRALSAATPTGGTSTPLKALEENKKKNSTLVKEGAEANSSFSDLPTLNVAAPIKSIFVARLTAETDENSVLQYMTAKNVELRPESVTVRKFKFKYERKSSSFRIFMPFEFLKNVLNKSFWPKGV